jgi:hypothetical protein
MSQESGTPRVHFDELELDQEHRTTWQGRRFTGVAFDLYPNGKTWSEVSFVEGHRHGPIRVWFPSGQQKIESACWNGGRHGRSRAWNEAGRLQAEATYELGVLVVERTFDDAGNVTKDWRIGPRDTGWATLQQMRAKWGKNAPAV